MNTHHSPNKDFSLQGPMGDLIADLSGVQLKDLTHKLFLTLRSPFFRANIKVWRKLSGLPPHINNAADGALADLINDLDESQMKNLVSDLFFRSKVLSFRASVKSWRKSQK